MQKTTALDAEGRRIGEPAPRAKLSQHEVTLLRELVAAAIEDGLTPAQAYRQAAEKFEVSASR